MLIILYCIKHNVTVTMFFTHIISLWLRMWSQVKLGYDETLKIIVYKVLL